MSDVSQGPGWWQASDGKWYPPKDADKAPAPGWWLASDGKWYPPVESAQPPKPGWWLAADGKWYPPKTTASPGTAPAARPGATTSQSTPAPTKPVPAKAPPAAAVAPKPAVKPVPAKPAAAKPGVAPVAKKVAPTKAAPAKPVGAKPGATGATGVATGGAGAKHAPAKPAGAGRSPVAAANPSAATTAGGGDDSVRRSGHGLSPEEQIRVRNEQSKRDAQALAGQRSLAATRALSSLQGMIDDEKASQGSQDLHESRALRSQPTAKPGPSPAPPSAKTAAAKPPDASPAKTPPAKTPPAKTPPAKTPPAAAPPAQTAAKPAAKQSSGVPPSQPRPAPAQAPAPGTRAAASDAPLLEVKQSALHSDIDHLGERLVIFNDRVELHDRNDRVRQTIYGPDIADVVVHKKFTGSTVTVESGTGVTIVAKGLKPDQADEIRALILKRTRQGSGEAAAPARPAAPGGPAANPAGGAPKTATTTPPAARGAARSRATQDDLLAKLADLHRAGVLTDDEFDEKKALIARLARGETLASSSSTPA